MTRHSAQENKHLYFKHGFIFTFQGTWNTFTNQTIIWCYYMFQRDITLSLDVSSLDFNE